LLPQVQRGEVFLANLQPTQGSEQGGTRPVIVISRDAINKSSTVVVVVPTTDAANKAKLYPSHVLLKAGVAGLSLDSIALGEQVRAINKTRLVKLLGRLNRAELTLIEAAVKIALDLP
jgi:mRNA interferase MazF